jgi:sec-independent protein translocase protein TatC
MASRDDTGFGSHLLELRRRLVWSLVGVFGAFTLVFALWADSIVLYIQDIAVVTREVDGARVRERIQFSVINPLETFGTTIRVSFYAAMVFAYPWVMMQAYWFIAPGLYRHERRFFQLAIPAIFLLFFAGAAFGRYILLPISIPFLLEFNVQNFEVQQNYTLAQFLSLVFAMTFGLGFVFQIPLIVAPLIRFGLLSPDFFKRKRRYTIFASVIIGALISPTGMVFDMLIAGAPVFFLVEGGVWAGAVWRRAVLRKAERQAVAAAERGEKVDVEALAGGLATDLEKKLEEFARGGARKFGRELAGAFREGRGDIESIFDDDYADKDKPPVEVRLKPRNRSATAGSRPDSEPSAATPDAATLPDQSQKPAARTEMPSATPEPQPPAAGDVRVSGDASEWPDQPWQEGVSDELARHIEDRISQRLRRFLDEDLRPWMQRVEHELHERNGDEHERK